MSRDRIVRIGLLGFGTIGSSVYQLICKEHDRILEGTGVDLQVTKVLEIDAHGYKRMFVPEVDAGEAALIPDLEVYPVRTLADLYDHLSGRRLIEPYHAESKELEPLFVPTDFSEIKGQEHVKRRLK